VVLAEVHQHHLFGTEASVMMTRRTFSILLTLPPRQ